jgi:hypothetical protein
MLTSFAFPYRDAITTISACTRSEVEKSSRNGWVLRGASLKLRERTDYEVL